MKKIKIKAYKTVINDKLIKISQDIKEPVKVIGKNFAFLVVGKNQNSIITLKIWICFATDEEQRDRIGRIPTDESKDIVIIKW